MTDTTGTTAVARPTGLHHVRLTVTDIARSKAFYSSTFGLDPAIDFSDQADDPEARQDPARFFGGCVFAIGDQLLGLRPVAPAGDRFDSTRVGLDHVSLTVGSRADLDAAAERLEAAGVAHGGVIDLGDAGMLILSFQDPDDINLELAVITA